MVNHSSPFETSNWLIEDCVPKFVLYENDNYIRLINSAQDFVAFLPEECHVGAHTLDPT